MAATASYPLEQARQGHLPARPKLRDELRVSRPRNAALSTRVVPPHAVEDTHR